MSKRRWLTYATICCVLFSGGVSALTKEERAEKKRVAAEKAAIKEAFSVQVELGKTLLGFDFNQQLKYVIDFNFSPFQAMSAYSELLLWVDRKGAGFEQGDDLFSLVREGLRAHVQLSAAGVPLAGWEGAGQPISIPFDVSLPRYAVEPQPEDLSTYKWRNEYSKGQITTASIGQYFRGISLFLHLTSIDEDRALSHLLLQSMLETLGIVSNGLFYSGQLGKMQDGAYMPEVLSYKEEAGYEVVSERSGLLSQLAMVQGLVRFQQFLSTEKAEQLFAGETIAGKDLNAWLALTHDTLNVTYHSLLDHHFDEKSGSFIGAFQKDKKVKRSILLRDAGMVVSVLNLVRQYTPEEGALSKSARQHLLSQAKYVQEKLVGNEGNLPKSYHLASGYAVQALAPNFQMQVSAMLMMLETYSIVEESIYLETAKNIYAAMRPTYWSEEVGLYRSARGYTVSAYDGFLFGRTLYWTDQMKRFLGEVDDFDLQGEALITQILKYGALQQCETAVNGEVKQLAEVLENEIVDASKRFAKLERVERAVATSEYVSAIVDQDGDSIPGCRFGGGDFGTAPVIIIQTSIRTPFPPPTIIDKKGNEVSVTPPGGTL
ncbi:MAG: hypothetical protein L3J28_02120 [Candidatus Polarisedimenticolaceae bacterium]|nr:hypothetical protein [Candidatus Polarisedimenticolaceae bacterium]